MDNFTLVCLVVIGLVLLFLAWRFLSGRRPAPPGTYDDPDVRSGGSFGSAPGKKGQSSYDDREVRSGGSFGGTGSKPGQSSNDDPDVRSGGSIGRQRSEPAPRERPANPPAAKRMDDGGIPKGRSSRPSSSSSSTPRDTDDDPDVRSGGSFGG